MRIGQVGLRVLLVMPLLAALAVGAPAPAAAATPCSGLINGGTIKDSLVVPDGQACTLLNVVVRGGLTVGAGTVLHASESEIRGSVTVGDGAIIVVSDSEIRGAVSGTDVLHVSIEGGVVRGNVTLAGNATVVLAEVRGNVTLTGAPGNAALGQSTVRGGVVLDNNAFMQVYGSTIEADLACSGNGPVTNFGQPNTVGGTKSGQCANL